MTLLTEAFLLACYVTLGPILLVPYRTATLAPPIGWVVIPIPNDLLPSQDGILAQIQEWKVDGLQPAPPDLSP